MKVLTVTNMYPTDETPHAGAFVKSQVMSLEDAGIQTDVVNINLRKGILKYPAAWWNIFKRSFTGEYTLIHAHYGYSGMISRLQWRLPVIVSFCGGDVLGNPNKKGNVRFISKLFLPFGWFLSVSVPAVIVKSREMKRLLPRRANVTVIPNGVDFSRFRPLTGETLRKRLNLKGHIRYILFPSNPAWVRKGYDLAVKAVDIIRAAGVDAELLVVYGKSHDQVPLYMNACDVLVLTSLWEGSPNVVKEAMACNLPVVTVDAGDAAEVIEGCEGCFLAERTPESVAVYLMRALQRNRRTRGREHIRHLENSRIARKILRLYTLAGRKTNG